MYKDRKKWRCFATSLLTGVVACKWNTIAAIQGFKISLWHRIQHTLNYHHFVLSELFGESLIDLTNPSSRLYNWRGDSLSTRMNARNPTQISKHWGGEILQRGKKRNVIRRFWCYAVRESPPKRLEIIWFTIRYHYFIINLKCFSSKYARHEINSGYS